MGDTQRSQTISTQNRTIEKQVTRRTNSANSGSESKGIPTILVGDASLSGIAILARKHPEMTFTSLAHRLDLAMLHEAFRRVKKSSAAGVDKLMVMVYSRGDASKAFLMRLASME